MLEKDTAEKRVRARSEMILIISDSLDEIGRKIAEPFLYGRTDFLFWFVLVEFYGISTIVGYLMSDPFLYI